MKRIARSRIRVLLPLLIALSSAPLLAADLQAPEPLNIETVRDFAVYRAAIADQLENSDTYAEVTPENRSRALTLMSEIATIMERSGSIAAMPALPRVDLFNRQEELNQILARAADDSRLICRRERPTGSKMPVNNCQTLAQRRKAREGGRQYLRDIIPGQEKVDVR